MNLLEFESVIRFVYTECVAVNLSDEEIESEYEMYKRWKDANDVYKNFIPNEPKIGRDNETEYGSCKGCKYYPRHLLRKVCAECDDWENYELIQ